jgi:hypothetical protein
VKDNETSPSPDAVGTVFQYAGLGIPRDRLAANAEIYSSTLALIRQASVPGLGETVPAVGFKAAWD